MHIVIHSPYGSYSRETGLIYLLANYIRDTVHQVSQLRCNGFFSLCNRDREWGLERRIDSCAICMNEQSRLGLWAGIEVQDLSSFISSREISETKSWILGLRREELPEAEFGGFNVFQLCKASLIDRVVEKKKQPVHERSGVSDLTSEPLAIANADDIAISEKYEDLARRLMLSAVRMVVAARNFNQRVWPDLVLASSERDFISSSLVQQSRNMAIPAVTFEWDEVERMTRVGNSEGEYFSSPLVLENISNMRSNYKTWSAEVIRMIEDLAAFLKIDINQLSLPLAR
jgi:hypothetical protein